MLTFRQGRTVRWREGSRAVTRTFRTLADAQAFCVDLERRDQLVRDAVPYRRDCVSVPIGHDGYSGDYVYFIQMGRGGPVKIGRSRDPEVRLGELQVGSPLKLLMIGTVQGDEKFERQLHKRLSAHRMRGEWFRPSKEVFDVIAECGGGIARHENRVWNSRLPENVKRCKNCGTTGPKLGEKDGLCHACREFADVRAAGGDPFEEAA